MKQIDLKRYCVGLLQTIREAMVVIEQTGLGTAVVVEESEVVVGIVTDGDLRRYLSSGGELSHPVKFCVNRDFVSVLPDSGREALLKILDRNISLIPVIKDDCRLVGVVSKLNLPEQVEEEVYARARSPVRISFGGGGSDVTYYFNTKKGAVLNATVSLYCHATLKKRRDSVIQICSYDLDCEESAKSLNDFVAQQSSMKLIQSLINVIQPKFGFELFVQSDFPPGSGLGGSSVVLSAILGCFNEFKIDKWTKHELAELAFQAERIQLGVEGGWQDQYASIFGGFNFIEFDNEENIVSSIRLPKETMWELEESLFLMFSGRQRESHDLHQEQRNNYSENIKKDLIGRSVELSYQSRNNLLRGKVKRVGELLSESWELKKQLAQEISNPDLDSIYNLGMSAGAIGGKLLGAGNGGYFLFSVPADSQKQFLSKMKNRGFEITPFIFDYHGMQSWTVRES